MNKFNKLYKQIINESGQDAGKMELIKIKVNDAKKLAKNLGILADIPNFDRNFKDAQKKAGLGKTLRKDMPVINDLNVKKFQKRLEDGKIDINKPFAKDTKSLNPFPTGLSGTKAQAFLKRGLKDGSKNDDKIDIIISSKKVGDLKPIQKQIYVDKSLKSIAEFGVDMTKKFLEKKTFFITSSDDFIIDGHHRFLAGMLVDPNMKVNTLSIDLPIKKLLPLSLAYGDSIGNKRNK